MRLSVSVLFVLGAGLAVRPRDWAWIAAGEMTTVTSRKKKIRFKMYTPGNRFELSFRFACQGMLRILLSQAAGDTALDVRGPHRI